MATPFLVLAGPYLNSLMRTVSTPTMTPNANTLFPVQNLRDGRSSKAAMFAIAADDSTIAFDLNMVRGTFESTDDFDAWTCLGVGAITPVSSPTFEGGQAAFLDIAGGAGATEARAVTDVVVRAGEELNFLAAAANFNGGGTTYVAIRNRQTGQWLSTDLSWGSTESWVITNGTTSYDSVRMTFLVEPLETCITDTVTLRLYLGTTGTDGFFDQVCLWPSTNWFSVHGHNIPPFISPTIDYSTDYGSTWVPYSTMTLRRDSFYHTFSSMETHQTWRLRLDGQPDTGSLMYIGELVVGQSFELLRNPNYGGTLKWIEQQTRQTSDLGEDFVNLHNVGPQRAMQFNFIYPSSSDYQQAHKQLFRGSRGGGNPICIAPLEMDNSVVILGRIRDSFEVAKATPLERSGVMEVVEMPLPNAPEIVHGYDAPVIGSE